MIASRMRARAISASMLVSAATFGCIAACSETRGSLGEDCLKNEDCLSAVCAQLRCAAAPRVFDGAPGVTVPPPSEEADAEADAGSDAAADALVEAAADARDARSDG